MRSLKLYLCPVAKLCVSPLDGPKCPWQVMTNHLQKWTWKTENCSCNQQIRNLGQGIQSHEYGFTPSLSQTYFSPLFSFKITMNLFKSQGKLRRKITHNKNFDENIDWPGFKHIKDTWFKLQIRIYLKCVCLNVSVLGETKPLYSFPKIKNLLWKKIMWFDVQSRGGRK